MLSRGKEPVPWTAQKKSGAKYNYAALAWYMYMYCNVVRTLPLPGQLRLLSVISRSRYQDYANVISFDNFPRFTTEGVNAMTKTC